MNEKLKEILENLPELPGSYQMYDKDQVIIYVGKAKNLKNRVRSYFVGAHNSKTTALVSKIEDIKYIVTQNEREAFLLEISLIKEHNPFYNIDLTDDKTYPYIEFTKEANPKLIITRKLSKNNSRYFGPYTNVLAARKTMELLNRIYKLRNCKSVGKKSCIYYDMGECLAPCINKIDKSTYDDIYKNIKGLLYGNDLTLINDLKKKMLDYSNNLDFENAKKIRDTINDIKETLIRQDVIIKDAIDADVYGIAYGDEYLSTSLIYLRGGRIIFSKNDVVPYYFDLEDSIYWSILKNYEVVSPPKYIFVEKEYSDSVSSLMDKETVLTPIKGAKKKLLDIAKENAELALKNKNKIKVDKAREALQELSNMLSIKLPIRIESFDNSNLFGDSPVSSLVVFVNGKKSRKEYRKYRVKTITGPNDYGTMKEVTLRRYERVKNGEFPKPDLILIDGGETQVKACLESLEYLGIDDIEVCGMKKDDTHSTNSLYYNNEDYELDKHSNLYKFLFEVQEEVHRFAITYHRTLKEKNDFSSVLDNVPGIGAILKTNLLSTFKSIDGIRNASDESLKSIGLNEKTIQELRTKLEEEYLF